MKNDVNFYKNISKNSAQLSELLKDKNLFSKVPDDWFVIVTDIENSTEAIAAGFHNDVNLSATGSIVTVLNTLKKVNGKIRVPYFFGGDGSTFIVPKVVLEPVLLALNNYSLHIKKTLELNLRVGKLKVAEIYANDITLRITKLKRNKYITTPIVLGNGLKYAERKIKENFKASDIRSKRKENLNLNGMECRWQEIYPNQNNKKVVCLLVDCEEEKKQAQVYGIVMEEINAIFGDLENRNPISTVKLKLNTSLGKIRKEMYARIGKNKITYLISNWLITFIATFYFKYFKAGKQYKYSVTQLSDTLMVDGLLNTVITGTENEVSRLIAVLDKLEANHKIIYGIHVTHASIMSCYIEDRKENHIHFVDGTEGGFTSAAVMFKEKSKKQELRKS